jgi:hypothetical protein
MSELRDLAVGAEIAGYRIEELAGRGGMGDVYRAFDTRLERPIALKLLSRGLADDETFRERLLRESRLAASLDHPNVVPIYEAGEADDRLFIAMRYVDGTDLKALLRRDGALEPDRAVAIAVQVADALDAAHARGLVHRDVKPSNVLLDQQGGREHAYLADFGLTQSVSDRAPTDGQLMGTVDYVAPEQIRGDDVDARADVYALGCLLFETLTGTLPFSGASEVGVVFAHLEEPPPAASERNPTLPRAVDAVLARAMAKDREERQASCGELVEETRRALGLATRGGPRWRIVIPVAIAAAVVAAAIVAGALLLRGNGATPSSPTGSIVRIDAATGKTAGAIRLGSYPSTIAASGGNVWVGSTRESALWKATGATGGVDRIAASGSPRDISIWRGRAYVASDGPTIFSGAVSQYDVRSGLRQGSADVLACSITAGPVGVWAAGCPNVVQLRSEADALEVARIVPIPYRRNATSASFRICLCAMASGLGSVWVIGDWTDPRLWRIDPVNGRIASTFELPFRPQALAVGDGAVWVVDTVGDRLARLDPGSGAVQALIGVGRGPSSVAVAPHAVGVSNRLDGTVSRIDPVSDEVAETIDVGPRPVDVAVDGNDVWVALEAP